MDLEHTKNTKPTLYINTLHPKRTFQIRWHSFYNKQFVHFDTAAALFVTSYSNKATLQLVDKIP